MKKGLLKSLKETSVGRLIFGIPDPEQLKKGTVIINRVKQLTWVRPAETFKTQIAVFDEDALVRQACLRQAAEVIGAGFFTQIAEDYKVRLPSPVEGIKDWNAKEAIDYFNRINRIDERLITVAIEMVAHGNSFWHIVNGIKPIRLEGVNYATARDKNIPIKDEYDIQLTSNYGNKKLMWGSFVHFRSNVTTGSLPFGQGIIISLLKNYSWTNGDGENVESPTPLVLRHSTRRAMMMGFEKFSFGNEMWIFPEASDPQITELNKKVKDMNQTGERVVTNTKGDIKLAIPQRTTSYDQWLKATQAEFNSLLEDPALKIHTETIFAKATAEEETKLFQKKILAMQRAIKREVEALWFKCLQEWGFNPFEAKARMNFGIPEIPEYKIDDILKASQGDRPVISVDEARQMLKESRWKIVEGQTPKEKTPEKPVQTKSLKETKSETQTVDVNINVAHEPIETSVKIETEPLKIVAKPIVLKAEPLKTEPIVVETKPQKINITLKEPKKNTELEEERLKLLKKASEKLDRRY